MKITKKIGTPICSEQVMKKLEGVVPSNASRVIIDIPANGVVQIYYTIFPDDPQFDVVLELIHEVINRNEEA